MFKRYPPDVSPMQNFIPLFKLVIKIEGEGENQKVKESYYELNNEYEKYRGAIKQIIAMVKSGKFINI